MEDNPENTTARSSDRPNGVNKKRLLEIDLGTKIPIWHRSSKKAANMPLIQAFSKEALTLFSEAAFVECRKTQDLGYKFAAYSVVGGDATAFKTIFAWIEDCTQQDTIVKVPELPEPESDPFGPTLKLIQAADILRIPAGSFSWFLEKRLHNIARNNLMPFSQVREFYSPGSALYPLKSVACTSLFDAWWDYRLDQTVTPELTEQLSDLRDEFPQLDQDLHDAVLTKDNNIKRAREEKKAKREAEMTTQVEQDFNGDGASADVDGGQHWEQPGWSPVGNGNADVKAAFDEYGESKEPMDWADESAAHHGVTTSGW